MELIKRKRCVITKSNDLEPLHTFSNFPVFMGCSSLPVETDLKEDMSWVISKSSGLIQLESLIPLDDLYPESHGAGCIGGLWNKHHNAFAKYIFKFNPSSVFEIGGHHGILAKEFCNFNNVPWTILEPNPTPVEGSTATFIKGFFDNKFNFEEDYDAVVHSHVFEHIYNPNEFMEHLSGFMDERKYLIFSVPNLQVHLERKFTYFIGFE